MEHAATDSTGGLPGRAPTASATNRNLWLAFTEEAKANRPYLAYALNSLEEAEAMADRLMRDRDLALQVMAERELGISPEVPQDPRKDAAIMAGAYVVGGTVPLSAYVFVQGLAAIPISMAVTLLALAAVGIAKARTARRSVLPSALEVMGIGAASGLLGFLLGDLLPRLFGAR